MGKFNIGDKVSSGGAEATIIGIEDLLRVDWGDGIYGFWPASSFELVPRKFKEGDFVRSVADDDTNDTVGIIFEDDGDDEDSDPYWVGLFNAEGEELPFSAYELIPWIPIVGERVIEADVEDDEEGVVIAVSGGNVRVLWDSFPLAQDWDVANLEPAEEFEDDDFEVGDVVTYSNPIFANTYNARVTDVQENIIHVSFELKAPLADAYYSKDFFSRAA
jgi:hypothetical protein